MKFKRHNLNTTTRAKEPKNEKCAYTIGSNVDGSTKITRRRVYTYICGWSYRYSEYCFSSFFIFNMHDKISRLLIRCQEYLFCRTYLIRGPASPLRVCLGMNPLYSSEQRA